MGPTRFEPERRHRLLLATAVLLGSVAWAGSGAGGPAAGLAIASPPPATANAGPGAEAASTPRGKCRKRRYRRARVCRNGRFVKRLLWRKRGSRASGQAVSSARAACVARPYLSKRLRAISKAQGFGICVKKPVVYYSPNRPSSITALLVVGTSRCIVANTSPGAPLGTVLSLANASRMCKRDGYPWAYVNHRIGFPP